MKAYKGLSVHCTCIKRFKDALPNEGPKDQYRYYNIRQLTFDLKFQEIMMTEMTTYCFK